MYKFFLFFYFFSLGLMNETDAQITVGNRSYVWSGDTNQGMRLTASAKKKLDSARKKGKSYTPCAPDYEYYCKYITQTNPGDCPPYTSNHWNVTFSWVKYSKVCNRPSKDYCPL